MSDPQSPAVGSVATVPVTSAWASKVNWTQVVGGSAMVLTMLTGGKFQLDGTQVAAIVTVIGLITQASTWVLHTWFTPGVKAASLEK